MSRYWLSRLSTEAERGGGTGGGTCSDAGEGTASAGEASYRERSRGSNAVVMTHPSSS